MLHLLTTAIGTNRKSLRARIISGNWGTADTQQPPAD
jgi:hypothetical protein